MHPNLCTIICTFSFAGHARFQFHWDIYCTGEKEISNSGSSWEAYVVCTLLSWFIIRKMQQILLIIIVKGFNSQIYFISCCWIYWFLFKVNSCKQNQVAISDILLIKWLILVITSQIRLYSFFLLICPKTVHLLTKLSKIKFKLVFKVEFKYFIYYSLWLEISIIKCEKPTRKLH